MFDPAESKLREPIDHAVSGLVGMVAWAAATDLGPMIAVLVAVLSAVGSRVAVVLVAHVFGLVVAHLDRAAPRHLASCSLECSPGCPIPGIRTPPKE